MTVSGVKDKPFENSLNGSHKGLFTGFIPFLIPCQAQARKKVAPPFCRGTPLHPGPGPGPGSGQLGLTSDV